MMTGCGSTSRAIHGLLATEHKNCLYVVANSGQVPYIVNRILQLEPDSERVRHDEVVCPGGRRIRVKPVASAEEDMRGRDVYTVFDHYMDGVSPEALDRAMLMKLYRDEQHS